MTVSLIKNTNRYQGVSGDSKPTTNVLRGSSFFEEDTGFTYKYTGSAWTLEAIEVKLITSSGDVVDSNHPVPVDGDSVYEKDVNETLSNIGDFSGEIFDLFNDLQSNLTNSTATNPKEITLKLNRPVNNDSIKFCTDTGNFSNVKIILKDASGAILYTVDESADDTKYTSRSYAYALTPWCTAVIQFHTADTVTLGYAIIEKSIAAHNIIQVRKPDGTYADANGTASGNQKFSLEEVEVEARGYISIRPEGTGSNGTVTLTLANTAYAIPTVAPTTAYRVNLYNGDDTEIFIGYGNTNANGIPLYPGDKTEDDIGASQQLYAYCASAGKVLTYTLKEVT